MATKKKSDFPKPLVRLTKQADGPGGYGCEVSLAADSDAVGAAKEAGYVEVDPKAGALADFVEFPKWVYHTDGRRQVVHSQDALDALDGYSDQPPAGDEPTTTEVPPPVAAATALDTRHRPPVPADRG